MALRRQISSTISVRYIRNSACRPQTTRVHILDVWLSHLFAAKPLCRFRLARGPFFESTGNFSGPLSHSKISNLTITELFYWHILNMKRGFLYTRSFRRIYFSVFRYRWTKNGFTSPKSFRSFRETGPWKLSLPGKIQESRSKWYVFFISSAIRLLHQITIYKSVHFQVPHNFPIFPTGFYVMAM